MRRRTRLPADAERWELLAEAAQHYMVSHHRERLRQQVGQPTKTEAEKRLEATIAEVLTKEELELVHNIARGDVEAPYPPRLYPDQCPTTLRDMAYVPAGDSLEVASLEERRRKRDVG